MGDLYANMDTYIPQSSLQGLLQKGPSVLETPKINQWS